MIFILLHNTTMKFNIPDNDFVQPEFDYNSNVKLEKIVIIVSTPRSGSTWLSDILYRSGICLPHEYFQPFQYMPFLFNVWNCNDKNKIEEDYVNNLIKHRTSSVGVLGINLHGSHLPLFMKYWPYFPSVDTVFIHLTRRDKIKQAVSYYHASVSGEWSEHYAKNNDSIAFNFKLIKNRLNKIQHWEAVSLAFFYKYKINFDSIVYEDLVVDPVLYLKKYGVSDFQSKLNRQSDIKKEELYEKFIDMFWGNNSLK
ncbi:hypothetical protein D5085_02110 [Ectothiorhodospiraceae bacterium BW-2]|nr:hypothetical protein D5085_02110 [Ectothiorhodospiraceae bacterium BW-2]